MTKKHVIDANVFISIILNEPQSIISERLLASIVANNGLILVPSLFVYEVISTCQRYTSNLQLVRERFVQLSSNVESIEIDDIIINKAIEIAVKGHSKSGFPSFYDAAYHALAIVNSCDFITADKRHYEKSKEFGHIVLLEDINI